MDFFHINLQLTQYHIFKKVNKPVLCVKHCAQHLTYLIRFQASNNLMG